MKKMPTDITVIITAHKEGLISGVTAKSAINAIAHAKAHLNLSCEMILVLDRTDDVTRRVLEDSLESLDPTIICTDEGDPGQARNAGIAIASGICSTFLDADDLWSDNWLTEAWGLLGQRPDCIAHSSCNVVFGNEQCLWWHIDSEGPLFNPLYLEFANYWDALSMARTEIYRRFPFKQNDLKLGFGHEDWHWNRLTIMNKIPHKPVLDTVHFKRRRTGSQMSLVEQSGSVCWPLIG